MTVLRLDADRLAVFVGGRACALTRGEFRVVAYLSAHPGFVRTRLQILDVIDAGLEADDRSIDTYVKKIRRKLVAVGAVDVIVSASGVGYSWAED